MKPKMILKILIDISMTVALLFLMAFELVGRTAHEWIGAVMFVLFVLHHILNRKWAGNLFKGKYTPFRISQTVIVFLVLISMLGSMVSGIILSRHVFAYLPISGGRSFARNLHMISAYGGFVLMAFHLGIHWAMMLGIAKSFCKRPSNIRTILLRCMTGLIAGYGIYAFVKREIGSYMFLQKQFVFFDFEEPLIFFFMDYTAVMGLFICVGHYLSVGLRKWKSVKSRN